MMKLWTPPKPTIAKPHVCGVCGGMLPEWLKENRHRGGFILMSACCCQAAAGPCRNGASIEATFSGVTLCPDAAVCQSNNLSFSSWLQHSFALDGTYALPYNESLSGGTQCGYRLTENNPIDLAKTSLYTGSLTCAPHRIYGSPLDWVNLSITVIIAKADDQILEISVTASGWQWTPSGAIQMQGFGLFDYDRGDFDASATDYYVGDAVPNSTSIANSNCFSTRAGGGTGTIALP